MLATAARSRGSRGSWSAGLPRTSVTALRIRLTVRQACERTSASSACDGARTDDGEYDVMIYVANWPEKRNVAWRTLLRARAIENQCYVIGTNRTGDDGNNIQYNGDSMVIDPLGEILYEKKDEEDINTISLKKADLQNIRETFPFLRDSDQFTIL